MIEVVLALLGFAVLALAVYAFILYNALVRLANDVDRAWANVDVVLKQRSDEVPNLVAAVKGYAAHETAAFAQVAQARAAISAAPGAAAKAGPSDALTDGVRHLLAVAEAYPDLKANASFLALQRRLSALEDLLADRRELYNETVATWNTRIVEIPEILLARRLRYERREYFRAEGRDRDAVKIGDAA